jgi:hypothetical protein
VSAALSASSARGSRKSASAAAGSGARLVWTASAVPLSSTVVPAGAPSWASSPGSASRAAWTPGGTAAALSAPDCHRWAP